jgi:predicted ATPase
MLNEIEICGFKSFKKQQIELRNLTLLCGFNNSGKSSVVQALRMFCGSFDGESPLLAGHGGVDELRSKLVSVTDPIAFKCKFSAGIPETFTLTDRAQTAPKKAPLPCYISADRWGPKVTLPVDRRLNRLPIVGPHGEFVVGFLEALRNGIVPTPLHHPKSPGTTLEYELAGWLHEIAPGIGLSYSTDQKRDAAHITFDAYRPTNVGFGLSHCLPLVAAILGLAAQCPEGGWEGDWGAEWDRQRAERGVLLLIENPEAHLHPRGQTMLGKLIALGAKCGLQIVVETQSDHLMDGIRIAVKHGGLKPEQVAFHYLRKNDEGETKVESPKLHDTGKLEYWPEGFFDQTLKNRSELSR